MLNQKGTLHRSHPHHRKERSHQAIPMFHLVFSSVFLLSGCSGFDPTPSPGDPAPLPRLDSSVTLSVPLPRGAALPPLTSSLTPQSPLSQSPNSQSPLQQSAPAPQTQWYSQTAPVVPELQSNVSPGVQALPVAEQPAPFHVRATAPLPPDAASPRQSGQTTSFSSHISLKPGVSEPNPQLHISQTAPAVPRQPLNQANRVLQTRSYMDQTAALVPNKVLSNVNAGTEHSSVTQQSAPAQAPFHVRAAPGADLRPQSGHVLSDTRNKPTPGYGTSVYSQQTMPEQSSPTSQPGSHSIRLSKSPLNAYLSGQSFPPVPRTSLLEFWQTQNRPYISRIESAKSEWNAKIRALTAAVKNLEIHMISLLKHRELKRVRESNRPLVHRNMMPLLQNLIPVFPTRVTSESQVTDPLNVILEAARDLDCDPMPGTTEYYPVSCDDDSCQAEKECRNIGRVGMCCPPSVTTLAIRAKAYYG